MPRSILIVTDAWHPQINGVVRVIERLKENLESRGIAVTVMAPDSFWTVPMPGYSEIRLSLVNRRKIRHAIERLKPESIHIATEGPLGGAVRRYCVKRGLPFSTAYNTQFPEYLRARLPVPLGWTYPIMKRFHAAAEVCLVPTKTVAERLQVRGFTNTAIWPLGVDLGQFHPDLRTDLGVPRPVFLYVGRVSVEKNIEDFLKLDLPGTKIVVGDGPIRARLARQYPKVMFVGHREGEELATYFASADAFVFPSRTDTFGLVLIESLASGTPVAAYPVTGPLDVLADPRVGVMDEDLKKAALAALASDRSLCPEYARQFSWQATTEQFLSVIPRIIWTLKRRAAA
ncbi:MAG: glycosyltransferase family 1 protein [Alphaproteobacteria bacterium]|nr:glycosyltransferase family 1 protein [Alphaproteobacteria bacterium]